MPEIELQDPLSTEIQSPTIAGIIESLNKISAGVQMRSETLDKVRMYPVPGLELSDPRRIYQIDDGHRIWAQYPEPKIFLNDDILDASEYTIDYIGGSITFTGDFRPSESDVITATFDHIFASDPSGGFVQMINSIPVEQRKKDTMYSLIEADYSAKEIV